DRARLVNLLLAKPERVTSTILLGNNLVNILASALATSLLIRLLGDLGVVYATILMTVLVVIFSKVLPKTWARAYADRVALGIAPAMRVVILLLLPFSVAIAALVRFILRITPSRS